MKQPKFKSLAELREELQQKVAEAASMNGGGRDYIEDYAQSILLDISLLSPKGQSDLIRDLEKTPCRASFVRKLDSDANKTRRYNAKMAAQLEKEAEELGRGPADERPQSEKIAADLTKWGYSFRTNELDDRVEVNGDPLTDGIAAVIRTTARDEGYGDNYSGKPSLAALEDTMRATAEHNRYNPLQEWFTALQWDGHNHFGDLCSYVTDKHEEIEYKDGSKRPVFNAFLWRLMLGAAARVFYTPMCQPPMMVMAGPQNIGKSTLVEKLTPAGPEYFVSQPIRPDQKDQYRQLMRVALWEVGELGATTRKADIESLKHFLTQQEVVVRHPYDKHDTRKPAISVFIGTINPDGGFLNDATGDRRFAVVEIEKINHAYATKIDMTQVWAQVYAHWKQNPDSWRYTEEEWAVRSVNNEGHKTEDRYTSDIARTFELDPSQTNSDFWMATGQIRDHLKAWGVKCDGSVDEKDLGKACRALGLERKQRRVNGIKVWGYQGIKPIPVSATDAALIE